MQIQFLTFFQVYGNSILDIRRSYRHVLNICGIDEF